MAKILVIGGGAMGSAFTIPCLDNKNNVTITEPYSKQFIKEGGTILCDDYNLSYAPGVRKAIDEFVKINNFKCDIICSSRFAKIEKL